MLYLWEPENDHDSCDDSDADKNHVEFPTNGGQANRNRSTVRDSVSKETSICDGRALAAKMGWPYFGTINVGSTFNRRGEICTKDEIKSNEGSDTGTCRCAKVVFDQCSHCTKDGSTSKTTKD